MTMLTHKPVVLSALRSAIADIEADRPSGLMLVVTFPEEAPTIGLFVADSLLDGDRLLEKVSVVLSTVSTITPTLGRQN